jgi:beta-1,4-mannooligosaccharide/beta-1,4-mannosyl-N-acetylglucosamine phosphorylase
MTMSSSEQTVVGPALPNLPWEDKPAGCRDVVWRYSGNPIIPRDLIPSSNSIFNSAAIPFEDGFAGVFRCDDRARHMALHFGRSRDGIHWEIDDDVIEFAEPGPTGQTHAHGYDPRVVFLDDRYVVTWCNHYGGPTVGIGTTTDFKAFHQLENCFAPWNRNGVLFPRKIHDRYVLLHRPGGPGHNTFGNIFLSQSPDLVHWGRHRLVMRTRSGWESTKIGAGPVPIETAEGWLLIYHGVLTSCNGFVYSAGVALLDLDEPWKILARARPYVLSPQALYECVGDVPNVVFPCAALADGPTGRIALYYGCADTVTGLAFAQADELIAFAREHAD